MAQCALDNGIRHTFGIHSIVKCKPFYWLQCTHMHRNVIFRIHLKWNEMDIISRNRLTTFDCTNLKVLCSNNRIEWWNAPISSRQNRCVHFICAKTVDWHTFQIHSCDDLNWQRFSWVFYSFIYCKHSTLLVSKNVWFQVYQLPRIFIYLCTHFLVKYKWNFRCNIGRFVAYVCTRSKENSWKVLFKREDKCEYYFDI